MLKGIRLRTGFLLVAIAAAGFLSYFNALDNDFVYDDYHLIVDNDLVKHVKNIPLVFSHDLTYLNIEENTFYRPLQGVSYIIDNFLWGDDPFGYHLTSILLHILIAILVFYFLKLVLHDKKIAILISLFYVVHPVNTQAVTYIAGRADLLVVLFFFLGIISYRSFLKERKMIKKAVLFLLASLFYISALFSKEVALIFPILFIFTDYFILRNDRKTKFITLSRVSLYFAFMLSILFWYFTRSSIITSQDIAVEQVPVLSRLIQSPKLLFDYIRISLAPFNLHMEYKLPFMPKDLSSKYYRDPFLYLTPFFITIYYFFRTFDRSRLHGFVFWGFGFFIIALLPYLNIFFLINYVFSESWLYLPEIGFLTAVISLLFISVGDSKRAKAILTVFLIIVIFFFGSLTRLQNRVWENNISLYTNILKYLPRSAKIHNNLGVEYLILHDIPKAKEHLNIALDINPNYELALRNMRKIDH